MCYNGLSSRATDLVPARPLMPRRPAVLRTSPRHIPTSSLFCTFCTLLQKSEAHILPLQSLPASLQKPRVCRHKRLSLATRHPSLATSANSSLFITLLQQRESHPFPFQFVAHSLCVYPGWHPERVLISRRSSPPSSHFRSFSAFLTTRTKPIPFGFNHLHTLLQKHRDATHSVF